jgi:hypothetical protein
VHRFTQESIMNSTPNPPERPHNPTHLGGEGLYESTGMEQESSLKVRLGDHLDSVTRESMQMAQRSSSSALDFVRSNPIPVLLALGGLVWLLASRRRRFDY